MDRATAHATRQAGHWIRIPRVLWSTVAPRLRCRPLASSLAQDLSSPRRPIDEFNVVRGGTSNRTTRNCRVRWMDTGISHDHNESDVLSPFASFCDPSAVYTPRHCPGSLGSYLEGLVWVLWWSSSAAGQQQQAAGYGSLFDLDGPTLLWILGLSNCRGNPDTTRRGLPLSFDPHEKAGFFVVEVPLIGHVISHIIKSKFIIDQLLIDESTRRSIIPWTQHIHLRLFLYFIILYS